MPPRPARRLSPLRVEELAEVAGVSVDTIRYYQARRLLQLPRREGRVAWYGSEHVERLTQIRKLAARGLTLATIGRLLRGELDSADEELAAAMSDATSPAPNLSPGFGLDELARRSGIPPVLLEASLREGFLVAELHDGEERFTDADVAAVAAGMRLLEAGLPLPEILALARNHHAAVRALAQQAVALFDNHVRQPLKISGLDPEAAAARLVEAFRTLLPATVAIVDYHFERTLLAVALEHMEQVGDGTELAAVRDERQRAERGA